MMPTNVLFPSIQMMECLGVHNEFQMDIYDNKICMIYFAKEMSQYISMKTSVNDKIKEDKHQQGKKTWWKVCWFQIINERKNQCREVKAI